MSGPQTKTIIITGASAGIGAATAVTCARTWGKGAKLVLAARRLEKLEAVAGECRLFGAEATAIACDVGRREEIDKLIVAALGNYQRLDVMIANAGYGFLANIHEATDQQFDDIVATNLKGTWYAMQAAALAMIGQVPVGTGKSARGHIIAVSSGAARRSMPLYGIYSMTKAAQLSLCEAMRVELKEQGIYVSSVHPLTTATEFFDVASARSQKRSSGLGRLYSAESVGRAIVKLIRRPRPECWPVFASRWGLVLAAMMPGMADRIMARLAQKRLR